jgi:hypothetical protein
MLLARILVRMTALWLWFGAVAGLRLENKYSVASSASGSRRRHAGEAASLTVALGAAALLFAPHLVWRASHSAPSEFMRNATELKNEPLGPLDFLGGQIVLLHPLLAPLWLLGLFALLFSAGFARVRALGVSYLAILALMLLQKAKVYYLAPVYPLLFASGAVALDVFLARRAWRNAPIPSRESRSSLRAWHWCR